MSKGSAYLQEEIGLKEAKIIRRIEEIHAGSCVSVQSASHNAVVVEGTGVEGNTNNQLVLLLGGADTIAKRSIKDSRDVSHIVLLLSSSGLGLLNIFSRSSFLFLNGFNDGGYG